ncbi:unnamed protein product [Acanthoscelides obtectus]|uniref:Uncharacterized protein n=1 Tax=Acanthoscelides obtectus TaxID=200917 RepID=A0A9P0LSB7_ACAOB|nr:unnamed protein product [Acanthoscelides obtectus]CAK1656342.1 hypothetical protein AOBTE_LOCUS19655 [Acanthoscelides obtectus]
MDGQDPNDPYIFHEDGLASPLLFDSTASTVIAGGAAPDVGNALLDDVVDIENERVGAGEASSSESDSEVELDELHVGLAALDDPPEVAIPEAFQGDNLVWDLDDPTSDSGYISP